MEQILVGVVLVIVGLCAGSFAGATIWRLRARQLVHDKKTGEKVDSHEYKQLLPLTKNSFTTDRSQCLHCGQTLHWYDLLPLASWLSTGGKCRYCHKTIGWLEPLIELGVALLFVGSYLLWPYLLQTPLDITLFVSWLIAGTLLAILFVYDLKWFLLPNVIVFPLIGVAGFMAVLHVLDSPHLLTSLGDVFAAVVILSGLYWLLWVLSKGRWIGFGDVKLGLGLALLLADWRLAFLALFSANVIGCIMVIPGLLMKKITRKTRVPFGPLLIAGTILAMLAGGPILDWYLSLFIM